MSSERSVIYMLAPLPVLSKRTRLKKQADVLIAAGFAIDFFGWERKAGETQQQREHLSDIKETMILRGGGYASRKTHLYYLLWMITIFFKVLSLPRGSTLLCLGFETAFPARVAAYMKRSTVIFDDADRFSLLMSFPKPIHNFLQRLEKWTSFNVAAHLIPGHSRYEWHSPNMYVLRNSPNRADFEKATKISGVKNKDKFTLYANGWIGETRGAPVFLKLMQRLNPDDYELIMIGRGDGLAYQKLRSLAHVKYSGEVSQVEALAAYLCADIALTYYDPQIPINCKAESNKWGDCVYLGVPFIVNSEVETAQGFVKSGGAFSLPYHDIDGLEDCVRELTASPEKLSQARNNIIMHQDDFLPFDETFKKILLSEPNSIIEGHNFK